MEEGGYLYNTLLGKPQQVNWGRKNSTSYIHQKMSLKHFLPGHMRAEAGACFPASQSKRAEL